MNHSTTPVKPRRVIILPGLADDATVPVRLRYIGDIVIALFSAAQETAVDVWGMLVDLFGNLVDVTPEVTA